MILPFFCGIVMDFISWFITKICKSPVVHDIMMRVLPLSDKTRKRKKYNIFAD